MASSTSGPKVGLEKVPPGEAAQIDNIADLTITQLNNRYAAKPPVRRGVHPKDHGCVEATFTVSETLDPTYRVGVFSKPGARFRAAIRFSNASTLVEDDATLEPGPPTGAQVRAQGSRGMAIKLYDVGGDRLVPGDGERTQDFLMINQPVFAFANVEDYEVISQLIADDEKSASKFFSRTGLSQAAQDRMAATRKIIFRIKGFLPPPFQATPMSPLDNSYFSAAPFLFGEGRAMKFCAVPVNPATGAPGDVNDPDYLRTAMRQRMTEAKGKDICLDFKIQVRTAAQLAGRIDTEIEDVCTLWEDPFVTVARIAIPAQVFDAPERQEFCEKLVYTPWHGLEAHQPIGGINRLRKKVYEASANHRGCPVSPELPPPGRKGVMPSR